MKHKICHLLAPYGVCMCNVILAKLICMCRCACVSNVCVYGGGGGVGLMIGTYSKTRESFWSPHMRISAMDRNVSTMVCLLLSVTVGFLSST